jgi:hypothetical protein
MYLQTENLIEFSQKINNSKKARNGRKMTGIKETNNNNI